MDTFCRKVDKSGSVGRAISDRAAQWRFYDRMSFIEEYIVNRKLDFFMFIYSYNNNRTSNKYCD